MRRFAAKRRNRQSNTGDTADRSREVSPLTREGLFTPSGPLTGPESALMVPGVAFFVFREGLGASLLIC